MAGNLSSFGNDLYTGRRSFPVVAKRRLWFAIAITMVLLSGLLLAVRGLNPGIEFRGGSEFTVSGTAIPGEGPAREVLAGIDSSQQPRISVVGSNAVRVQTEQLTNTQTEQARLALAEAYEVPAAQVTSSFVGPIWGADVTTKALQGMVVFILLVSIVIAVYFRSWRMALAAIIALIHDLVVTVGLYAGVGFEVTPATVIGFLTILAYSVYDTVVVYDKVRENAAGITEQTRVTYAEAANLAVNQTIVRSINTTVVGVLPVGAILFVGAFLMGAGTLRDLSLALFIGMIVSAVSSILLATPLQVWLVEKDGAIAEHTAKVHALRAGETRSEDEDGLPFARAGALGGTVAGHHMGQAAQPRRPKTKRR